MSLRLKSHTESPPNGYLYVQTQTGWRSEQQAPSSQWDWNLLVRSVQAHRAANPQYGLPTDFATIERELDYVNALRVTGMRGGSTYVTDDERPPPPKSLASRLTSKASAAVVAAGKVKAGALTLLDWNLSNDPPVELVQASVRAQVCVACPLNGKGDLTRWFTVPIAGKIQTALSERHAVKLETAFDDKLGVCEACACPLPLKIWAPIEYIKAHMPEEVKKDLAQGCWILREMV